MVGDNFLKIFSGNIVRTSCLEIPEGGMFFKMNELLWASGASDLAFSAVARFQFVSVFVGYLLLQLMFL